MKRLLSALFAPAAIVAPAAPTGVAAVPPAPPAVPHLAEAPTATPMRAEQVQTNLFGDPLASAERAFAAAYDGDTRAALAAALAALAVADFSALPLNGPHTRAGDRVSRKALNKARRVLALIAEAA